VLFEADLRPLKEARGDEALAHPRPGWVEQDPEEVLATVVDEVLADRPDVAAYGLAHEGESELAWDAESGPPLTPIIAWQDKRSQAVLDRLESQGRGEEIRERRGLPLDPYISTGKLTWLLEHDDWRRRGA
jgi:glycerol kinase